MKTNLTQQASVTQIAQQVTQVDNKLRLIVNPNPIVDNSKLPTGCRYCELREEQSWNNFI